MLLRVLLEGLGLGLILVLICAFGIRNGAVGLVHFYHADVQERCVELGLTTHEKIKRNSKLLKLFCLPVYLLYVLLCVYALNSARGFWQGFWQLFVIFFVMNLIDRIFIDGVWVCYTNAWNIPGTEDLKPYITTQDKCRKWLFGTVGLAGCSAILAGIFALLLH